MQGAYSDLETLIGYEGSNRLARARVAVFGIGSVGSYVVEALARSGIGSITLVDYGDISEPEMNRQLYTLPPVFGKSKVQSAKERIHSIDEDILVHSYETHYGEDTAMMFDLHAYDYVIDTLGILDSKLLLIEHAKACKTPVLSCMDVANKMNPMRLEIADISRTSVCPTAKAIRTELRKKGIHKVKVLYSRERIKKNEANERGSISYMSGIAGFLIASEVIRDLLKKEK